MAHTQDSPANAPRSGAPRDASVVRWRVVTLLACAELVLAACPLPVSYTAATSAPVVGRVAWDDGAPARDVAVLLSTDWASTPCGKVARRAVTDAAGRFELAGTTKHSSVTWVVPMLDVVPPRYDLCVSVHDTVRHAYTGVGALGRSAEPDSVTCVLWRWEGSLRVSCAGHTGQAVATGGRWSDSARTGRIGFYRLLLTEEPTQVKGYKRNHPQDRPYVYVQWVEPIGGADSARARYRVDTTVSLPIDRNKVTSLGQPQLWRRGGRWMASVQGFKRDFMNDFARAELIFALGAPGVVTKVAGP